MTSFLQKFDLLGYFPQLYVNLNTAYRTNLGGTISIFIWIGIIYALIAYTIDVLINRMPNVVNYTVLRSDIPVFDYSAKTHFEFMIVLLDDQYNVQPPDRNIVDIGFFNNHLFFESIEDKWKIRRESLDKVDFGQCSEDIMNKMGESFHPHIRNMTKKMMCPQYDVNKLRKIGGSLIYKTETYQPRFYIKPKCQIEEKCQKEEIKAFKNYTSTVATSALLILNYYNPNPKDINPKTNVFKYTSINLKETQNSIKLNYVEVSMSTDSTLIPSFGLTDETTFFTLSDIVHSNAPHGDTEESIISEFEVNLTDLVAKFDRKYLKLDSIITRLFSFYLSMMFLGRIFSGFLYTYNLERYLINSTIINESSINIKFNEVNSDKSLNNSVMSNIHVPNSNNLQINLVEENLEKFDNIDNIVSKERIKKNSVVSQVSSGGTEVVFISPNDNKLHKLKSLYAKVKQMKLKFDLKQRYSCSELPDNFKKNVEYLYKLLDARSIMKLFLQFEKFKQIFFNEEQKLVFELFNVDISFLDKPLHDKNIEEMNDKEIKTVIECLESVNEDKDESSKKLIELLPEEFRQIMFN